MLRRLAIPTIALGLTAAVPGRAHDVRRETCIEHRRSARSAGPNAGFTEADKAGFGTAHSRQSRVWFTLQGGRVSEVFYPDLSTPSLRTLELPGDRRRPRRPPVPRHDDRRHEAGRAQPAVHPGEHGQARATTGSPRRSSPTRPAAPSSSTRPSSPWTVQSTRSASATSPRWATAPHGDHTPQHQEVAQGGRPQGPRGQHAGEQPQAVRHQHGPGLHHGEAAPRSAWASAGPRRSRRRWPSRRWPSRGPPRRRRTTRAGTTT